MRRFYEVFGLDTRSLFLFRICLGFILLVDLLNRIPDFQIHYAVGAVGRVDPFGFPVSSLGVGALFVGIFLSAVGMITGIKQRLAIICAWLFILCIHRLNPGVLQGGDVQLRLLLFWSIFLPFPASIGQLKNFTRVQCSPATAALLIQIAVLYISAALLKKGPEWSKDFSAVYYVLQLDMFRSDLGDFLLKLERLHPYLTRGVWLLELMGPLLLFVPFQQKYWRVGVVASFVIMQLSFAATLRLGLFPFISILAFLPLIPSFVWDKVWPHHSTSVDPRLKASSFFSKTTHIIVMLSIAIVLFWNASHVLSSIKKPWWLQKVVYSVGLDQRWGMFAPRPLKSDFRFIIAARTANGKFLDLFPWLMGDGESVLVSNEPGQASTRFKTYRWRKMMLNMRHKNKSARRRQLLEYTCRMYNSQKSLTSSVEYLELIFVEERSLPPSVSLRPSVKIKTLESFWCSRAAPE